MVHNADRSSLELCVVSATSKLNMCIGLQSCLLLAQDVAQRAQDVAQSVHVH